MSRFRRCVNANDVDGLRLLLFGFESAALIKPELNSWKVGLNIVEYLHEQVRLDYHLVVLVVNSAYRTARHSRIHHGLMTPCR